MPSVKRLVAFWTATGHSPSQDDASHEPLELASQCASAAAHAARALFAGRPGQQNVSFRGAGSRRAVADEVLAANAVGVEQRYRLGTTCLRCEACSATGSDRCARRDVPAQTSATIGSDCGGAGQRSDEHFSAEHFSAEQALLGGALLGGALLGLRSTSLRSTSRRGAFGSSDRYGRERASGRAALAAGAVRSGTTAGGNLCESSRQRRSCRFGNREHGASGEPDRAKHGQGELRECHRCLHAGRNGLRVRRSRGPDSVTAPNAAIDRFHAEKISARCHSAAKRRSFFWRGIKTNRGDAREHHRG